MKLVISTKPELLSVPLKQYLQEQIVAALDHLGKAIESIRFRLQDLNGPRGGLDKQLLAVVKLRTGRRVVQSVVAATPYLAIDELAGKLKESIARANKRDRRKNEIGIRRYRRMLREV